MMSKKLKYSNSTDYLWCGFKASQSIFFSPPNFNINPTLALTAITLHQNCLSDGFERPLHPTFFDVRLGVAYVSMH